MAKKAPRAQFALPGGRFPLNTPGRIAAAPGLAAYSRRKGNLSAGQEALVDQKVKAAKGGQSFSPMATVASSIVGKPKAVPKVKKSKPAFIGVLSSMNKKSPF